MKLKQCLLYMQVLIYILYFCFLFAFNGFKFNLSLISICLVLVNMKINVKRKINDDFYINISDKEFLKP
jgi:hypothetical protein